MMIFAQFPGVPFPTVTSFFNQVLTVCFPFFVAFLTAASLLAIAPTLIKLLGLRL